MCPVVQLFHITGTGSDPSSDHDDSVSLSVIHVAFTLPTQQNNCQSLTQNYKQFVNNSKVRTAMFYRK
jgi:hypothetical protein